MSWCRGLAWRGGDCLQVACRTSNQHCPEQFGTLRRFSEVGMRIFCSVQGEFTMTAGRQHSAADALKAVGE